MAYNVGVSGGRERERYAQVLPGITPYEYREDLEDALADINNAATAADAARLRIIHHNRLRVTPDLDQLQSVIAVAEGLPLSAEQAEAEDEYLEAANDKILKFPGGLMQEILDDDLLPHSPEQPLHRSEVLEMIEEFHGNGQIEAALTLQRALAGSDWGEDLSVGVRIESSGDDVETLEVQYTGLEGTEPEDLDPSGYVQWRQSLNSDNQAERGIAALKFAESTGLPAGASGDGLSYDTQQANDAEAVLESMRME